MSPFIDGTLIQFAWDSTSLGWFKDCPRKYYYSMIEGWRTRMESVHLKFGLVYHSALELYDRRRFEGDDHDAALIEAVLYALRETWTENGPWISDHKTKTRENLIRTIVWYLEQFKDDPAKTIKLDSEAPGVELSFRLPLSFSADATHEYILCGHLDRIVEFQGSLYVTDRKTTSMYLGPDYFSQYDVDGQMSGYTLAGQAIFHTPVKGVMIDAAQILVGSSSFARGFTYRTSSQLEEWIDDTQYWIGQAYVHAIENNWPLNDRSCNKYGGCPFRRVCSKDPSMRERFLESDFVKHPWNPLEVR